MKNRKNQGLIFSHNGDLQFMACCSKLFLLQHFGISLTENEYIGLRLMMDFMKELTNLITLDILILLDNSKSNIALYITSEELYSSLNTICGKEEKRK